MFLLFALYAAGAQPALPDIIDVDGARTERIHNCLGSGGIVHCRRFRNLHCAPLSHGGLVQCSYNEWAGTGPWPRKTIVLRRTGDEWHWVSGDQPHCSMMVITDEAARQ